MANSFTTSVGAKADNGREMFQAIYPGTVRTVSVGATTTQSAALSSGISLVRVVSDTDCYIAFGSNPTATTSSTYLPSGVVEYFGVAPLTKIAVIQKSASGTLNITEGQTY